MPSTLPDVAVQEADFDVGAEIAAMGDGRDDVGAIASFVGLVRADKSVHDARVQSMTLEHYPGMTEKALTEIITQARQRWNLLAVRVVHRIGRLVPGDRIVLVLVASAHRGEAFAACEFIMDYLKTRAPFWKKEDTERGGHWVDAREADDQAALRWGDSAES
jgi:molybdopterin synthase catalytic subunit